MIVMVGGDRLWVSDGADEVVEALTQARREEFCAFGTAGGTLHINPAQVAYVEEGDPPPGSGGGRPRED